ncbi:MAG: flagellar filament capping protein FliD [Helicobacteraceae bacterium]|jgi:flagellar hook-associated protein 2|nr:flagellar filament capping protein FliD [Helicobacteraceae bacterium]
MATGSISSLGVTYGGASTLNADLIDKLREADKTMMLKPLQSQLEKVYKKQEDQTKLVKMLDAFQDIAYELANEVNYLKRNVSVGHDSVAVTTSNAAELQEFKVRVDKLATNSVWQLNDTFTNENAIINTSASDMKLKITRGGGNEITIDVKSGMTLGELRDAINEQGGGKISASILNLGGGNYNLVVKTSETGADQNLEIKTFEADGATELAIGSGGMDFRDIQTAQDAELQFNGMMIKRGTNTITDLVAGATIELKKADQIDSYVKITRDFGGMSDNMDKFVKAYNELNAFLDEITKVDTVSGNHGSFQGDSRINTIRSELNKMIFGSRGSDDRGLMAISREIQVSQTDKRTAYAFELSDKGVLTFDKTTFEHFLNTKPDELEKMLRGKITIDPVEYVGNAITIGQDRTFAAGDLIINGEPLLNGFSVSATDTAKEIAQKLITEINSKTDVTGVSAKVSGNGDKVILYNKSGNEISVAGTAASFFGFQNISMSGRETIEKGIFTRIDEFMDTLNGFQGNARMTLVDQQLRKDEELLTNSMQKVLTRLTAKYELMAAQFASYNLMISKYESSFSSLQQIINEAASAKK